MTLARGMAVRLYGLLFRGLAAVVTRESELDEMLHLVDGEGDAWFLQQDLLRGRDPGRRSTGRGGRRRPG
jgi:hypothetical protein